MSTFPLIDSSGDKDDRRCERRLLDKFHLMVQGLPPPISVTVSKLSAVEMLQKYRDNEKYFQCTSNYITNFEEKTTPLVFYLNSSKISEEIASLSQRVQERYVQSETMSSCNIWFESSIPLTSSARKRSRARKGLGMSPGHRLSHLAKRRQVFSCANLQQMANSDKRRHIEIKRNGIYQDKNQVVNRNVQQEKLNSSKRSLFLSPDDEPPKLEPMINLNIPKRKLFTSSEKKKPIEVVNKRLEVSRWLNGQVAPGEELKKRWREDSFEDSERKRKCPRRSLTFSEDDPAKSPTGNSTHSSTGDGSSLKISQIHKNKLLWAISVSLKEKNILRKEPTFKTCASSLFLLCKKNLDKILNSQNGSGTSEKMLHFARQNLPSILGKLGVEVSQNFKEEERENAIMEDKNESKKRNGLGSFYSQIGKENSKNSIYHPSEFSNTDNKINQFKTPKKNTIIYKKADTCSKIITISKTNSLRKLIFRSKSLESLFNDLSVFESKEKRYCDLSFRPSTSPSKQSKFMGNLEKSANDSGYGAMNSVSGNSDGLMLDHSPIASSVAGETDSPKLLKALVDTSHEKRLFSDSESEKNIDNQDESLKNYLNYRSLLENSTSPHNHIKNEENDNGKIDSIADFTSPNRGWDISQENTEPETGFQAYIASELLEFEKLRYSDCSVNQMQESNHEDTRPVYIEL